MSDYIFLSLFLALPIVEIIYFIIIFLMHLVNFFLFFYPTFFLNYKNLLLQDEKYERVYRLASINTQSPFDIPSGEGVFDTCFFILFY